MTAILPALEAPTSVSPAAARPGEAATAVPSTPFDRLLSQAAAAMTPAAALPTEAAATPTLAPTVPTEPMAAPLPAPAAPAAPVSPPLPTAKPLAKPLPLARLEETLLSAEAQAPLAAAVTTAVAPTEPAPPPEAEPSATTPEALLGWIAAMRQLHPPPPPAMEAALPSAIPGVAVALTETLPRAASTETTTSAVLLASSEPNSVPATPNTAPAPAFTLPVVAVASAPVALPAAEPPLSPISLPMDSPDWPQKLGEQIQWHLGVGIQEARIEVSPRDLGLVDVRLSVDDSGLRVHLSAAHAQTRELLQNELPRLREALQDGGLLLADAQVGREAPGRNSAPQATRPTGRGGDDAAETAAPLAAVWRRQGLLDDYA